MPTRYGVSLACPAGVGQVLSMRIGVVGSGSIGGTLAPLLAAAGHQVVVANTRGPESLRDLAATPGVEAGTIADAAAAGELVVLAIPFGAYDALAPDLFDGRVVVDAGTTARTPSSTGTRWGRASCSRGGCPAPGW